MVKGVYFILLLIISLPGYSQLSHAKLTDPIKKEISLYPNPAVSTLWVNIDNKIIVSDNISVYNVIGNELDLQVKRSDDGKFMIDVSQLPAGYYLLVVENKDAQFARTIKFLKK